MGVALRFPRQSTNEASRAPLCTVYCVEVV